MSSLLLLRVCIDFGLVVLIWMVQRIVYPGFLYYSKEELVQWHRRYTPAIASIVGPLMIIQLGIAVYQCIFTLELFSLGYLGMVLLLWGITFVTFVPLHAKLGSPDFADSVPQTLVIKNWLRTILWTLLFVWSIGHALLS